jgi:hypothetical protein
MSKKRTARIAGFLYLILIICGTFAELFVRSSVYEPGNASATARNIWNARGLYRLGFVSDMMMVLTYFLLPLVLYQLLKPVSRKHAVLMVASALMGVSIISMNLINHLAPLILLDQATHLNGFSTEQINSLAYVFLYLHQYGYRIAQLFFGLWLLPFGYLVYHSGFIPKIFGILLMIAFGSFSIDFFLFFLLNHYSAATSGLVTLPTVIGEFSICFWLLLAGIKKASADDRH